MSASSAEFLDLQEVVAGRYSLEREIGRGGMGIVFLARDVALERSVAIKLLPPHMARDEDLRERFLREARTAAQLMHPNIVPIHLVESHGDIVFFVMALVDGETLAERVRRVGLLDPADAIRLMQEVAWALGYAHGRGIVHRDIKPDNILIEHASGRALVADFGIARVAHRTTLSGEGAIVGTVQYMSPEQVGAEALDGRSDVYSLGATVYFALTGQSPVEAPTIPAMLAKLVTEAVVPVTSHRTAIPAGLADAVMRCLAKSRDDRFAGADTLAMALQNLVPRSTTLRPEIRHFLREVHNVKVLFLMGLAGAPLLAVLIVSGALPPSTWPAVALLPLGGMYIFGVGILGALMTVARARVPREDVEAALTEEVDDINTARRIVVPTDPTTVRVLQALGVFTLSMSAWMAFTWWRAVEVIPASERSLTWYVPFLMSAVGGAYGILSLATIRAGRPIPEWLEPKPKGGDLINSWPLRLARAVVRRGIVRWLYSRRTATEVPRTASLPTATLLLNRVEELIAQLPETVRSRLSDVVPVASALERAIASLRGRVEKLDSAIAELPVASAARDEFALARTRATQRLEQCVSALETLRTDCLRLSAGLIAADGITADVVRAQELSTVIDAELHGIDESRRVISR